MKKFLISLGCLTAGVIPAIAETTVSLQPESCSIGGEIGVVRPFVAPLTEVGFSFDDCITLLENAKVQVKCEGETVAIPAGLEVSNYSSGKYTQGTLIVYFDEQLLPKGKTYTLSVATGSVALEKDASVVNTAFEQSFIIPEDLGAARMDAENGCVIVSASSSVYELLPGCEWGFEVLPADNAHYVLYREGVQIREIPADVSSDWDLGSCHPEPEEKIYFEDGVHYTLVLPAGSVRAWGRSDIVNQEEVLEFIGGYTEPIPSIDYVWCSLFTNHSNVLNVVSFTYNRPVRLADNAVMQLWYADDSEMIMEVPLMYVEPEETTEWLIAGDFGGYTMTSEKGYTIVIPEGTIMAADGAVNKRTNVNVNASTGIEDTLLKPETTPAQIYDLNGRKIHTPEAGQIYIVNGKKVVIKK